MDKGFLHFEANLILEDIFAKGERSLYVQMAPTNILNPYQILDADDIITDFRNNFVTAEDQYYRLRRTGTLVKGTIYQVDSTNQDILFFQERLDNVPTFEGTLRVSLDKNMYKNTMPVYLSGQNASFMCSDYRPIHNYKDAFHHKVEIRLIECKAADDYYKDFQEKIKARLVDIFNGRESVNPELAKGLATLYWSGELLEEKSVCLEGSFLACHENLTNELAKKFGDVTPENVGAMKIDPNKTLARKFDQMKSDPAERPENADRSVSGEKIHDTLEDVQKLKSDLEDVNKK